MRMLLVLVVLAILSSGIYVQPELLAGETALATRAAGWVRTAAGWERAETWFHRPVQPPALHPFVVAAGQVFGSLFVLLAFPDANGEKTRRRGATNPTEAQATRPGRTS